MREQKMRSRQGDGQKQTMLLPKQEVMQLLPKLCSKQDFKFRPTETRNVLFLGKSRSGKTTVIRTLEGVENAIKPLSIFSDTENVHFRSFSLQGQNDLDYTFNIIDTPGLFQVKRAEQKARTNKELLDMISECLKNEITKLHAIVFFCSLTVGLCNTDVIAMKKLIDTFGVGTNMAIVVTGAESTSTDHRDKIVKELEEHVEMGALLQKVNHNIFFMGAVDPERIINEEALQSTVDRVLVDRSSFLKFIFLCSNATRIEDFKFAKRIEK